MTIFQTNRKAYDVCSVTEMLSKFVEVHVFYALRGLGATCLVLHSFHRCVSDTPAYSTPSAPKVDILPFAAKSEQFVIDCVASLCAEA